MTDRRRGLGKGLGALIPTAPAGDRPSDLFFTSGSADGFTGNDSAVVTDRGDGNGTGASGDEPGQSSEVGTPVLVDDRGGEDRPVLDAQFAEIPLHLIRPNPRQPRQVFDEEDLGELVASIAEVGLLQPVVVRPVRGADAPMGAATDSPAYELIMGERRLRASKEAGRTTIPAIVRLTDDEHMLRDALLENLHRAQLNALEEAAAYQQLLEDFGCTHEELASRIGRSRPQISNAIRLLRLPPLVQRRVASGVLSAGHARALLGLGDGAAMERLAQRIVAEGLSVRAVEEIVVLGGGGEAKPRRSRGRQQSSPRLEQVASDLSDRLDTRVQVVMGRSKGRITVEFAGADDLERILSVLAPD